MFPVMIFEYDVMLEMGFGYKKKARLFPGYIRLLFYR